MSIVQKMKTSVRQQRQQEDNLAAVAVLQANVDYIAMMTDVELEEDDDETTTTEESEEE
ncbi:MAG: hypothetical protein LUE89_11865 [Clostridiales bacterium]|nr:hypothetical protein [Clostridiales bacterium]